MAETNKMKCNLIVATALNGGIGINGKLPWHLRKELAYFSKMTQRVSNPEMVNAVLMGRKTWESIPQKNRPLPGRLNVVLTRTLTTLGDGVIVHKSLLASLKDMLLRKNVETVWVIGGSSVYEEVIKNSLCDKIYMTCIYRNYQCDAFFPNITTKFIRINDNDVPQGVQEEKGVMYEHKVYERATKGHWSLQRLFD